MPKTKKTTCIIKSNINSKLNIGDGSFNNILKPTFPSTLSINEIISVIKAPNNIKKAKTFPNAFITYKKALIKENHNKNIKLPPMGQLSKVASYYWNEEPENVKEFYRKLSEKAKSFYKQNVIQIVFDKNMIEVEETSRVTSVINKADSNYVNNIQGIEDPVDNIIYTQNSTSVYLPIEDNSASGMSFFPDNNYINSSQASFPNSNFFEDRYLMNQIPNDQEYIKTLECERIQFSPDSDYFNYIQGIEVPGEDIIFTPNSYLPIDYSACNLFDREYGMEHNFTDFVLVENNQESVSIYGTDSDYKL
ncbi:14838_t:CDS:1 [Funneliformis mosseae]|uniref:14838_t:CDS:1 n=1 Tax=Funneliformis mosseae TaxID=27381 RepID=A0A9N9E1F0_FUNMO|nr:14838_t:CDS:1 [Funneliformis mosseae]